MRLASCPVVELGGPCGRPLSARGVCKMHYERWRRRGSLHNLHRERAPVELRFWSRVQKGGPDECWPWLGRIDEWGYGRFDTIVSGSRKPELAHRVAWFFTHGEWPSDETLDHECHNQAGCLDGRHCQHRRCCNPSHVAPKSIVENLKARPKRPSLAGGEGH